jgi:spermidine synthase
VAQVYILHLDADLFMSQINGKFDVIILDFPDPGILELSKLFSLDFYSQVRKRLNQGGVIALQATSPFFAKEAFLCIGKTLESAGFHTLPYHGTIPSFSGEWGWYLGWHKNEMNNTQMQKKIADQKEISVPTKYLTPEVMHASFIFGKGRLSSETKIEVNTKFMPKLVHYYRQSWKKWE